MTSSTLDLSTAVITLNAAYFGRLGRLAVEDARAGLGLATNSTPELLAQSSVELLPHALDPPGSEVVIDRLPVRQIVGLPSNTRNELYVPRATTVEHVENAV